MQIEISVLFSITIALVGVYATFAKINRDGRKDREERERYREESIRKSAERHGELNAKLDTIVRSNEELVREVKSMDKRLDDFDKRLIANEASTKSVHKRVDEINSRCKMLEGKHNV